MKTRVMRMAKQKGEKECEVKVGDQVTEQVVKWSIWVYIMISSDGRMAKEVEMRIGMQ